jgi:RNA polymerase sigma factor (sigma-70 family)
VALRFRATSLRRFERERLVAEYWYLCRRAARRFLRRGLDRADLEQVGAIGLIKAVDRFDRSRSAPFEAYAWLLIVGELMHYVRDSERVLRAPRSVRELERRWSAAECKLWSLLGREPTESDVVRSVGATPEQARELRAYRASRSVLSFEVLHGEKRDPPCAIDDLLDRLTVERMLQSLPPLQRQIVRSIHIEGVALVDVATRLGYSRRHVTRLHRAAIERLRGSSEVGSLANAEQDRRVSLSHRG